MKRLLILTFSLAVLGTGLSGCAIYPYELEVPIPVIVVQPGHHRDNHDDRDRHERRDHRDDDD